ncbi:hypothetical protein HDU97_001423 [Phlyctochytrium planicorne]|nr:hypothetical protein HDU97_001423 [Phlyctochytrium planicorne]
MIADFPDPFAPSAACDPMSKLYDIVPEHVQFDESIAPKGFNIPGTPFQVKIPCGHIDVKTLEVSLVEVNKTTDVLVDGVTDSGFRIPKGLPPGLLSLLVTAERTDGLPAFNDAVTVAFGSLHLLLKVVLADGITPAVNATVSASLTTHRSFKITNFTDEQGWTDLNYLPPGQSLAVVITLGNMVKAFGVKPLKDRFTVRLPEFGEPSEVDNLDFSLGLEGWDIDTTPGVTKLIDHVESKKKPNTGDPATARGTSLQLNRFTSWRKEANSNIKKDMSLTTRGFGTRYNTYTAKVPKGFSSVEVEYMFITSEFPKYFGKEFDDSYSITLMSKDGTFVSQANSMNALGYDAFDNTGAFGATNWMTIKMPVNPKGDIVRIDLSVSNVADGQLDSTLIITEIRLKKDKPIDCKSPSSFSFFDFCPRCVWGDDGPTIGEHLNLMNQANRNALTDRGIKLDSMKKILLSCPTTCNRAACKSGEVNCMGAALARELFLSTTYPVLMNVADKFLPGLPDNAKAAVASIAAHVGAEELGKMTALKNALTKRDFAGAADALQKSSFCSLDVSNCETVMECMAGSDG